MLHVVSRSLESLADSRMLLCSGHKRWKQWWRKLPNTCFYQLVLYRLFRKFNPSMLLWVGVGFIVRMIAIILLSALGVVGVIAVSGDAPKYVSCIARTPVINFYIELERQQSCWPVFKLCMAHTHSQQSYYEHCKIMYFELLARAWFLMRTNLNNNRNNFN